MATLDDIPATYDQAVQTLARWHAEMDSTDMEVFWFPDPQGKVVRLLEVSDIFPDAGTVIANSRTRA